MKSQDDVEMVRPFVDGHVIICIAKWLAESDICIESDSCIESDICICIPKWCAESDDSVVDAIEDLRIRNLKVKFI